ncbi:annexin-2 receptor [Microcebus murinus]|uniref:annexin-2 receptor n=1 Tax=Microcebus murinus TaxID=30608 RepID=UPI003F6B78BD
MERRSVGRAREVAASPAVAPEPQPAPTLKWEDRGPGPLPWCAVLGEPSLDGWDSGSTWGLRWLHPQDGLSPRVQSTWGPGVGQPTEFLRSGKPDATGGEVDLAEEPDVLTLQQPLLWAARSPRGDTHQDPDASDSDTSDGETPETSDAETSAGETTETSSDGETFDGQSSDGESTESSDGDTSDDPHLCDWECCQPSDPRAWARLECLRRVGRALFFPPWRCCLCIFGDEQC